MEQEEKQFVKPPLGLSFQLFIFMMLVVISLWGATEGILTYKEGFYEEFSVGEVYAAYTIDLVAYLYAFFGIYKTLQHQKFGIVILKFSVLYVTLQLLSKISAYTSLTPVFSYLCIPLAIGGIVFFIYIYKSKKLKEYIPLKERTFGTFGVVGIIIYLSVAVFYSYHFGCEIVKRENSKPVSITRPSLPGNYYTDGIISFKPLSSWKLDSIHRYSQKEFGVSFKADSTKSIFIITEICKCTSRLDFCQLVSASSDSALPYGSRIKETGYGEEKLGHGILYYGSYLVDTNQEEIHWTLAVLAEHNSYKAACIMVSDSIEDAKTISEIKTFAQHVNFNLKQ